MSARYRIATLDDIGAIPEEALPRFLAELPSIIETRKMLEEAVPSLAKKVRDQTPGWRKHLPTSWFEVVLRAQMSRRLFWIDDGKGTATVSMRMREGDEPFFSQTEPLP